MICKMCHFVCLFACQDVFVFEPEISKRSEKLVLKRRQRALSAGSRREEDIGILHSIEQHQHWIEEQRQSMRSRSPSVGHHGGGTSNSGNEFTVVGNAAAGGSDHALFMKAGAMLDAELDLATDVDGGSERRKLSIRSMHSAASNNNNSNSSSFVNLRANVVDHGSNSTRGRSPTRRSYDQQRTPNNQDYSPARSFNGLRSHSFDAIRGRSASPRTKKAKQWVLKEEKSYADSK